MSSGDNRGALESLTPEEREKVVEMLARFIIERRKEKQRLDDLKKI